MGGRREPFALRSHHTSCRVAMAVSSVATRPAHAFDFGTREAACSVLVKRSARGRCVLSRQPDRMIQFGEHVNVAEHRLRPVCVISVAGFGRKFVRPVEAQPDHDPCQRSRWFHLVRANVTAGANGRRSIRWDERGLPEPMARARDDAKEGAESCLFVLQKSPDTFRVDGMATPRHSD